jgi:Zn-dependent peptidase ImmA (M78 family)/transcriptional regulator with XRE-family HTH domain
VTDRREAGSGRQEADSELLGIFGLTDGQDAAAPEVVAAETAPQPGLQIRRWRALRGITAVDLAHMVGLTPDKLSKVERGTRRLAPVEVPAFAEALGVSIAELFGTARPAPSGLFAFRGKRDDVHEPRALTRVRTLWEVENRLIERGAVTPGVPHPAVRALTALVEQTFDKPRTAAEAHRQGRDLAVETRRLLDLGTGPLGDLGSLMERLFGVDVVLAPLDDDISGICAHDEDRASVLANTNCARSHVRFTLGHELGHHLFADPRGVIAETTTDLFRHGYQERRANSFAAHLLLPTQGVEATLTWLDIGKSDIEQMTEQGTIAVGYLMAHFGASLPAVVYQLSELRWLTHPRATQIKDKYHAMDILAAVSHVLPDGGDLARASGETRIPSRLYSATLAAAREGKVGMHSVAQLLDREESDDLFDLVMRRGQPTLT